MKRHDRKQTGIGPLILSRRNFIRVGCCSVATLGITAALNRCGMMSALAGAAADYRALVCVFLFGGNDSNNLIVPTDIPRLLSINNFAAASRSRPILCCQ